MTPSTSTVPQPPYPIHESVKEKLHHSYIDFYNKHIVNKQQLHLLPISTTRAAGSLVTGGGPLQPVGSTEDISIQRRETQGPDIMVRAFTPQGVGPEKGWPIMIYIHGGGWVFGDLDTESVVCTHLCSRVNCVVVSIDYRLAPEHPFPAAVHDCWEGLLWVQTAGATRLHLDLSNAAISGYSAGGNLAATMCHKALTAPSLVPRFKTQILVTPVTDNTAHPSNNWSYKANEFVPALSAVKMVWYRNQYLPDRGMWAHPEASPLLYESGWAKLPKTLIILAGLDILRAEGEQYAGKMLAAGAQADVVIMEGMPHTFLELDDVLRQGQDGIAYMVSALKEAFGGK